MQASFVFGYGNRGSKREPKRNMRRSGGRIAAVFAFVVLSFLFVTATPLVLVWAAGRSADSVFAEQGCEPLRITDRTGRLLRTIPAACGHRGRESWLAISEVPRLLREAVIVAEDKRFYSHFGVDPIAVGRAFIENVKARKVVSGASTLTMQLMRILDHPRAERGLTDKLKQAWLAVGAERRLAKSAILEAYFNHAYYGQGAIGLGDAARTYFGKPARALSDGEASLLAVLPRAPTAYDPTRHLDKALARRHEVLGKLVELGRLSKRKRSAVEAEPIHLNLQRPYTEFEAPHFVDWVVTKIPDRRRRAGGELLTTLDLKLQRRVQEAVSDHFHRMAPRGITQAGVVVLDTKTSEIRAMVGSGSYSADQLNIAVRRRHPGSLLKPFVYALAIEKGANPATIAYDVGDIPSNYRARDWVGREGGPLRFAEALSGSYNLAAVHLLERVGVGALRNRLRTAGVAELSLPPESYGLKLALGSARVRLLDAAAGFGFLVREGMVRRARAITSLTRLGSLVWREPDSGETRVFSPSTSWLTMDMLSDPTARHRRFGRGLPVEGDSRVVAKTGTASGLSDTTTVLASREWIVGAWAGRFDGMPAKGISGMWAAAPLARLALDIALEGKPATLPERPSDLIPVEVCALSGEPIGPACPQGILSYALSAPPSGSRCSWHQRGENGVDIHPPDRLQNWIARARVLRSDDNRKSR